MFTPIVPLRHGDTIKGTVSNNTLNIPQSIFESPPLREVSRLGGRRVNIVMSFEFLVLK